MDSTALVNVGDLVRCYNWQYFGEIALVLEVVEENCNIYIFADKKKRTLHKSLLSLLKRCPPDKVKA